MTYFLIKFISIYQALISPVLDNLFGAGQICRYEKTCSLYAKEVIQKYGILRGIKKSFKRIVSCNPFFESRKNISI